LKSKLNNKKIILASASPRRKELLEQIGLTFEVDPSQGEEIMEPCTNPHDLARALSRQKTSEVATRHPNALVIGADTFIVSDKKLMGKAHNDAEARAMLRELNGKSHSVVTGFTVMDTTDNRFTSRAIETRVWFRSLTQQEIDSYIATGEPIGKAGAYAIQGKGAVIVEKIMGDYSNVVGLPLHELAVVLKRYGVSIL